MALIQFQNNTMPYLNAENLNNNFTECNNIVASGSNENGNYIKYSDGTMICWHSFAGSTFDCTQNASGTFYFTDANNSVENHKTWTFPVAFVSKPTVTASVGSSAYSMPSVGGIETTYAVLYCVIPYSVSSITFTWNAIAIGKWK